MYRLRSWREEMGVTALQMARTASCPVETILHAEFGIRLPQDDEIRGRLARAYRLPQAQFLRLAFDAAEGFATRQQLRA